MALLQVKPGDSSWHIQTADTPPGTGIETIHQQIYLNQ